MWRSRVRVGAVLMLAALLSACAAPPRLAGSPTLQEYSGRFSVSWRDARPEALLQRSAGRFVLRVDGERSEVAVSSPLGQTLAVVSIEPGSASLVTADGAVLRADSPESLTGRAFGWPAPLGRLPRWLAGTASALRETGSNLPGSAAPDPFEEAGWLVTVDAWQAGRPQRLTLRWPAALAPSGAQTVELRLLVDDPGHFSPPAPVRMTHE